MFSLRRRWARRCAPAAIQWARFDQARWQHLSRREASAAHCSSVNENVNGLRNPNVNAKLNIGRASYYGEASMASRGSVTQFPRVVRPVPDPLGHYVHVGHNDHKALSDLIAAGDASLFGVVMDATLMRRQSELRDQAVEHNLDVVLNPKTQEMASVGGYKEAFAKLPWGRDRPHTHSDYESTAGRRIATELAQFALDNGFTQVIVR
jgi:hypothetical protein